MREKYSEDDIPEDDDGPEISEPTPSTRVRSTNAWRSIERYREMKELRRHLDDYFFEELPERQIKDLYYPQS